MAQAKRVAHLVGDQLGDQRPNEPLRHTVECDLGFFWLGLRLVAALVILLAFLLGQLGVQLERKPHGGQVERHALGGAAKAVHLADAPVQAVKLVVANQFAIHLG